MKNKKPYLFIFILIAFVILSLIGLEAKADVSGNQIRNQAISWKHLADSLRGTSGYTGAIAFLSATGHVAYAETSTVVANGGVKTTAAFSSALRDSLRFYYIDSTNTARLALTVVDGAIDDTANFSQGVRDGLFGRNATKWIYYVQNALRADTSTYATRSGTSALADSALNVVSPDTVPYADVSGYSKLSGFADAATYATTAGSFTSTDTSITLIKLALSARDSIQNKFVHWADSSYKADSLQYGAFDSYDMFSTAIKSGYIPTAAQKLALAGITTLGGNPSAIYRYADSLYVAQNYVGKPYTAITGVPTNKNYDLRLGIGVTYNPSQNYWGVFDTTAGSSNNSGHHFTFKLPSKTMVFPDSLATYGKIAANLLTTQQNYYDYNASGSATHTNYFQGSSPISSPPAGSSEGDICFDSTAAGMGQDTANMWIYAGNTWRIIKGTGSGGGSSVPTAVTFNNYSPTGDIDVDSLVRTYTNGQVLLGDSILFPHNITADTIRTFGDRLGTIGSLGRGFAKVVSGQVLCDTLAPAVDVLPTNDSMYFRGKAFLPVQDLQFSLGSVNKGWSGLYSRFVYPNQIIPVDQATNALEDNEGYIGSSTYNFGDGYIQRIHADDSVVVGNLTGTNIVLKGSNGQITTNGGITVTGAISATGNVSAGTNLITPENYFIGTGSLPRYGMSQNQWYAMDDACSPNDSNEIMTRSAVTRGYKNAMDFAINADSVKRALPYYWRSFWAFMARNVPECQSRDSLGLTNDADFANIGSTELSPAYIDNPTIVPVPEDTTFDQNTYTLPRFVGIIEADTATRRTGKMLIRDWDNPLARGEYIVCDNGSDSIGMFTGYFKTIQAALNNIPNLRIRPISSDLSSGYGRYLLSPVSSATYNGLVRYGSTVIDTISGGGKRDSVLLNYFVKTGSWFCIDSIVSNAYEDTNARKKIWASIDYDILGAVNARQLTFADTQAFKEQDDKVYLTIARPWTITVWPNAQRAVRVITAPIDIPNYAPVTIKGVGEDETIISNMASGYLGTAPSFSSIFRHKNNVTIAAQDTIAGLPITIKDMTIVGRSGSSTADSAYLMLSGNVRLENLTIIGSGGSYVNRVIDYKGLSMNRPTQYFTYKNNSLYCENVTVAADTDRIVFNLRSPVRMQSRNSTYGIAGSSGRVLVATDTLGANPQFAQDEFFVNTADGWTTPTYIFEAFTAQSTLKFSAWGCHYIGKAETFDGVNWTGNSYASPYNIYESGYNDPPVKLVDSQKRFQVKRISPK